MKPTSQNISGTVLLIDLQVMILNPGTKGKICQSIRRAPRTPQKGKSIPVKCIVAQLTFYRKKHKSV